MTITEQEVRKAVAECTVTKISGQPTNQDLDRLEEELTAIASSFPSELGGGAHGHAGLVRNAADYALFAPGTPFVIPANPGHYPAGPIPTAQRAQREAEHKALVSQFQTCVGVSKGLKDLILQAVEEDFLLEIRDEVIAYLNVSPLQMLTHLRDRWGTMDFVDITSLLTECDAPWNPAEVPTKYFNRVDKVRKQLARANVQIDERAMLAKALKSFKDAGDFDAAIREWEARPAALQTYTNLKTVMCTEFSKLNRQDSTTAQATGHALANNIMEEMAQATEELIAELTEKQSRQVETLIKANNEAIEKLTAAIKASNQGSNSLNQENRSSQNNSSGSTATAGDKPGWLRRKEAAREKWRAKKENATTCPHCDRKHPNQTHDQCWELPANADKRPANWKSVKST
jgi:hypothetical protein